MKHTKYFRCEWRDASMPLTLLSLLALLLSLALPAPALADPPGRIGRVAWLSEAGGLTLDNRDNDESFRAPLNQPLTSGDVLSTDTNARAEIRIGSMTLRLDEATSLELTRIDDERVDIFLRQGRSIVRLTSPETVREFELSTPDGRFTALDTGIYRFEAEGDGSSATAYQGTLRFSAHDTALDISAGERADLWFAGQTRYRRSTPLSDDFMHWSAARDQSSQSGMATRYVSPEMTGAEDLDAYGDWSETSDYGPLWTPRAIAADWAPYRTGHWAWVAPWGWSWIGHEPWGFAPFHYGRWVQHRGRWSWVPGTYQVRPIYAPAMVAWTAAPEFNITFSFGRAPTVRWFPLAPREVYAPLYRSSSDYVRRVNRTHVAQIRNINEIVSNPRDAGRHLHYAHRDQARAMTKVPADSMLRHDKRKRDDPPRAFAEPGRVIEKPAPAPRPLEVGDDRRPRQYEPRPDRRPDARMQATNTDDTPPVRRDPVTKNTELSGPTPQPRERVRAAERETKREVRQPEQRSRDKSMVQRPEEQRRTDPADDLRKRRQPRDDGERN